MALYTRPHGHCYNLTTFLRTKYTNIDTDPESIRLLAQLIPDTLPTDMTNDLETPFTLTEIHNAISTEGRNRAPGRDGLGIEFYKNTWAFIQDDLCSILNTLFFEGIIIPQQNAGIIVCLPKPNRMLLIDDRLHY